MVNVRCLIDVSVHSIADDGSLTCYAAAGSSCRYVSSLSKHQMGHGGEAEGPKPRPLAMAADGASAGVPGSRDGNAVAFSATVKTFVTLSRGEAQ